MSLWAAQVLRFDAHCHVFGLGYLRREIPAILKHLIISGHIKDIHIPSFGDWISPPDGQLGSIWQTLRWLRELLKMLDNDEQENWDMVVQHAAQAWNPVPPEQVGAIPLLMDIFYMFDPPMGKDTPAGDANHEAVGGERELSPDEHNIFDHIMKLAGFQEQKDEDEDSAQLESTDIPLDFACSPGLRHHIRWLQRLQRENPGRAFPFFAVDPRRPGVIAAILKGQLVSPQGPFYGIKLYPRLGYHPQCAALQPLFEWCHAHAIPVVTHAAEVGFPTWNTPGTPWGNPKEWIPILERYPRMRILFAHFGMMSKGWDNDIAGAMEKHPQVYSDLACITQRRRLVYFKLKHYRNKAAVRERTLFGTDYDVMYFADPKINLASYYAHFQSPGCLAFDSAELQHMSEIAPRKFLGLDQGSSRL